VDRESLFCDHVTFVCEIKSLYDSDLQPGSEHKTVWWNISAGIEFNNSKKNEVYSPNKSYCAKIIHRKTVIIFNYNSIAYKNKTIVNT
jgi:hypothetical protein